ncbi:hypothetical protein VNO77_34433 [Canavalia gladiata]|uniref:Uncharacterized protein n=1 Tax=Canavalia gladiata TaxID=3824 RepID=A0AAN9KG58_CANGL
MEHVVGLIRFWHGWLGSIVWLKGASLTSSLRRGFTLFSRPQERLGTHASSIILAYCRCNQNNINACAIFPRRLKTGLHRFDNPAPPYLLMECQCNLLEFWRKETRTYMVMSKCSLRSSDYRLAGNCAASAIVLERHDWIVLTPRARELTPKIQELLNVVFLPKA